MNKRQIQSRKKENGQADGVSARPLVGNLFTLLDLREKILTMAHQQTKNLTPLKRGYNIDISHVSQKGHKGFGKRTNCSDRYPKGICTK